MIPGCYCLCLAPGLICDWMNCPGLADDTGWPFVPQQPKALMPCTQGHIAPGEEAAPQPQGRRARSSPLPAYPLGRRAPKTQSRLASFIWDDNRPCPCPSWQPACATFQGQLPRQTAVLLCPTIISPRVSASWRSNRRRRTTLPDRCPQRRPPPAAPARDPPSRPPLLHQPSVAAAAVDRAPAVRQGDRTSADPGCFQPEGDRARLARRQRVALWSAVPLRLRWPRALYTHTPDAQPVRS